MNNKIEELLELDEELIEIRKRDLRKTIRTIPGTEYLKNKAKIFDVQPWPFISYLAYYIPNMLDEALNYYQNYDGAENKEIILEGLREGYIICELIKEIDKEKKTKK